MGSVRVLAFVVLLAASCVCVSGSRAVSWWYSADNGGEVASALSQVQQHKAAVTSVMMYCGYSVAPNGNLSYAPAGFYCDGADGMVIGLRKLGVKVEFVVDTPSGDPLQPFLNAFANPDPIIDAMVAVAQQYQLYGWNMDLEPASSAASDAAAYEAFLTKARPALAAVGTRLTIDVADWSPMLSQYPLLARAGVRMMDMETYNGDSLSQWMGWYSHIVNGNVPRNLVSVGLGCWVNSQTNNTWAVTKESGVQRLAQISKDGVTEISMFRLLPSDNWPEPWWWPLLEAWISGDSFQRSLSA